MYDLKWSHAEKTIARRAFEKALGNELEAVIREAKSRADASRMHWDLESWLTERRLEIDRRYDYRYSVLPLVFASLLRDGKLTHEDLNGLRQEKLDLICKGAMVSELGHENFVMAAGCAAGKPLRRRFTDVWQRRGVQWVQIVRQATILNVDATWVYGSAAASGQPQLH